MWKTNDSGADIQNKWCKKQIYQKKWRVQKTNKFGANTNYIQEAVGGTIATTQDRRFNGILGNIK